MSASSTNPTEQLELPYGGTQSYQRHKGKSPLHDNHLCELVEMIPSIYKDLETPLKKVHFNNRPFPPVYPTESEWLKLYCVCVGYKDKDKYHTQVGVTEGALRGETPEQTSARAMKEELGLLYNPEDVIAFGQTPIKTKKRGPGTLTYTIAFADKVISEGSDMMSLTGSDSEPSESPSTSDKVLLFLLGDLATMSNLLKNIKFQNIQEENISHFVCIPLERVLKIMSNMCNTPKRHNVIRIKKT
jgi:ADP-ribose pyrophosphatase YjhB (NUDIX family)